MIRPEDFGALHARVDLLERGQPDLREDLKKIAETCGRLDVALARLPTWDHLNHVSERVNALESKEDQRKGAFAALAVAGSLLGAFFGWVGSVVIDHFSK